MKKLLAFLLMLGFLGIFAPSFVSADSDEDDSYEYNDDSYEDEDDSYKMRKTQMKAQKTQMKAQKEAMKAEVEALREEAKANRAAFREEYGDDIKQANSALSDEDKEELEELRESFKEEMEDLREALKEASTDEAKDDIRAQMKTLSESHLSAVTELLGEDSELAAALAERKAVFEENSALRAEARETRREALEVRKATVEKYRTAFITKIGSTIDKLDEEKLALVNDRIDAMIEKTTANESMDEAQKTTLLSALVALKEIVEEKLEGDDVEAEVMDVIEGLLE